MTTPAAPVAVQPHHRPVLTRYALPLSLGRRVRITAFTVSDTLRALVVATNTGSIHWLQTPPLAATAIQQACEQQLSGGNGSVSLPSPSLLRMLSLDSLSSAPPGGGLAVARLSVYGARPDVLAVVTVNEASMSGSTLHVIQCNPYAPKERPVLLHRHHEPTAVITHLLWRDVPDERGKFCLLTGDNTGSLTRHIIAITAIADIIRRNSVDLMHRFDSGLVQLSELSGHSLLASTVTRAFVVDIRAIHAQSPLPAPVSIGSKARKEAFGACVDPLAPHSGVLCGRPGRRIWKADAGSGTVLATLIVTPPPPSKFTPVAQPSTAAADEVIPAALQFSHLAPLLHGIVCWTPSLPYLSFIDIGHACVTDWFDCFHRVLDVQCIHNLCLVLDASSEDTNQLTIVRASAPNSYIDAMLKSPSPFPLPLIVAGAIKYKIYHRELLTKIRARVEQESIDGESEKNFESLIIEAERVERLEGENKPSRSEWWDRAETPLRKPSASANARTPSPTNTSTVTAAAPAATVAGESALPRTVPSDTESAPAAAAADGDSTETDAFSRASLLPAENLPFEEPELAPELQPVSDTAAQSQSSEDAKKQRKKKVAVLDQSQLTVAQLEEIRQRKLRQARRVARLKSLEISKQQQEQHESGAPLHELILGDEAKLDDSGEAAEASASECGELVASPLLEATQPVPQLELELAAQESLTAERASDAADSAVVIATSVEEAMEDDAVTAREPDLPSSPASGLVAALRSNLHAALDSSHVASLAGLIEGTLPLLVDVLSAVAQFTSLHSLRADENLVEAVSERYQQIRAPLIRTLDNLESTSDDTPDESIEAALRQWRKQLDAAVAAINEGSNAIDRVAAVYSQLTAVQPSIVGHCTELLTLHFHCRLIETLHAQRVDGDQSLLDYLALHSAFLDPDTVLSLALHYRWMGVMDLHAAFPRSSQLSFLASLPSLLSDTPSSHTLEELATIQKPFLPSWIIRHWLDVPSDELDAAAVKSASETQQARFRQYLAFLNARCAIESPERAGSAKQFLQLALAVDAPHPDVVFNVTVDADGGSVYRPARRAHHAQWNYAESLISLTSQPAQFGLTDKELMQAFALHGFYPGLIPLYHRAYDRHPSLSLYASVVEQLLCLDDLNGVRQWIAHCIQRPSLTLAERREYLVRTITAWESNRSDGGSITLASLLLPLTLTIGAPLMIHLLSTMPSLTALCSLHLSARFYDQFLSLYSLQHAMHGSSVSMIETIDCNLWSERVEAISGQTKQIMSLEARKKLSPGISDAAVREASEAGNERKLLLDESSARSHWGRRVERPARCEACTVTVSEDSEVDGEDTSIDALVYSCGHIYHRECASNGACTKCFH